MKVTALEPGAHIGIKVTSSLADAFGASGTEARGTDGDYQVTTEYCDQVGPLGAASHASVHTVGCGHFDESNLIGLTADAKRVLLARGSRFES